MSTWTPLSLLTLGLLAACGASKTDDDDDDGDGGDGGNGGGWDLGTDSGLDGGSADGGTPDGGSPDGGGSDGGSADGGAGDGGSDGGSGDGGSDGGSGDGGGGGDGGFGDGGGGGDGGFGDGGGGDGGSTVTEYCNAYWPLEATGDTERVYTTLFFNGETYTETTQLDDWSSSSGTATLIRSFEGGSRSLGIHEHYECEAGVIRMSGYDTYAGSSVYPIEFSAPVTRLRSDATMDVGTTWTVNYRTSTGSSDLWEYQARFAVTDFDSIRVDAGTFDTMVLEISYEFTDLTGYIGHNSGTITWYLAPGLGLVFSEEYDDSGTLQEQRELTSYGDFSPFDPAEL